MAGFKALLLPLLLAAPLAAEEPLWRAFGRHLVLDAREAFWGGHLAALAAAGGAAGALALEDRGFQDRVQRDPPLGKAAGVGSELGMPYVQFGSAGLAYSAGRLLSDPELVRTSELMLESLCVAGVATAVLKGATRRRRPDGSNRQSFPSGHASGSFALATVAGLRHGWKAGLPAGLLAAYVSWSRVEVNRHYVSDSLFGAALGAVAAHAVWRVHREEAGGDWLVLPAPGGVALALRF